MPSSASAPPHTSTLSLHDALPICQNSRHSSQRRPGRPGSDIGKESPPRQIFSCHSYLLLCCRHFSTFSGAMAPVRWSSGGLSPPSRSEEHTSELQSHVNLVCRLLLPHPPTPPLFPYTTLFRSARTPGTVASAAPVDPAATSERNLRRDKFSRAIATSSCAVDTLARSQARWRPSAGRAAACRRRPDRKSTRLNSSHMSISYAVFCFRTPPHLHSFPTRRSSDLPELPAQ